LAYFQRRTDEKCTGWWQLIEIIKALQSVPTGSVQEIVRRVGWPQMKGLAGIRAYALGTEAKDSPFIH